MKALVKYAPGEGNVDLLDVEEPSCGPQQVKVEIAFCGLCGTDLHVLHDTFVNYPPVILGHEMAGTVVETGKAVREIAIGDRVTILGATSVQCGECVHCRSGYFIFCPKRRGMGHGVNGGFAKYVVVRPDQLYKLPEHLDLDEAALSEPFAAAVQAVTQITKPRQGETALISGPGPIGLLCLKLLVADGLKVVVAGAGGDAERLQKATAVGAAAVVNTATQNLSSVVLELTRGIGVDLALECAGHPDSVRACLQALRPMGRYTQVAICGRDIQFPIDRIFYKQLTMSGSICYTVDTWKLMMDIYGQKKVRLGDLITARLPLSDWRAGFDLCVERKGVKVLLYPDA